MPGVTDLASVQMEREPSGQTGGKLQQPPPPTKACKRFHDLKGYGQVAKPASIISDASESWSS
jgi:hypothetical protein